MDYIPQAKHGYFDAQLKTCVPFVDTGIVIPGNYYYPNTSFRAMPEHWVQETAAPMFYRWGPQSTHSMYYDSVRAW